MLHDNFTSLIPGFYYILFQMFSYVTSICCNVYNCKLFIIAFLQFHKLDTMHMYFALGCETSKTKFSNYSTNPYLSGVHSAS